MPKVQGPRLLSPGTNATGTPAHPKYPPLTVTDYVRFKAPGSSRKLYGDVLAPLDSSAINVEITGDEVRIQAEKGGAIYTVPRESVTAVHGKALVRARERKNNRPRRLRRKATRIKDAPYVRVLLDPAPMESACPSAPAQLLLVKCGPAQLVPVPKEAPPVRSTAYREFVRGRICIACERSERPTEAHHEGDYGLGVKCDDLLCVPLCAGLDGCHFYYTNHNHLPGLSRVASLALMHDAQRVLLVEFVRRLLGLLSPPCLVDAERAGGHEQHLFDLLCDEERSYLAEVAHA